MGDNIIDEKNDFVTKSKLPITVQMFIKYDWNRVAA